MLNNSLDNVKAKLKQSTPAVHSLVYVWQQIKKTADFRSKQGVLTRSLHCIHLLQIHSDNI